MSSSLPLYVKRLFKFSQLDFEVSIWEMLTLMYNPRRVYKQIYYHVPHADPNSPVLTRRDVYPRPHSGDRETDRAETKGHYRRDDPSFAVLLSFFLCVAALAWGLAYARGFLSILKLMVFMVGVDFALVGLVIATTAWVLARRFLRGGRRTVGVSADVIAGLRAEELEFGYCFDVHCNAFFPVFVWLYVVQYVVMPLLMRDLWYTRTPFDSLLASCGC